MSKSSPLLEMTKCRWREFRREPSAFFFVLLMPIVWMIILGLAFSGDKKITHSVGVFETPAAESLITQLKGTDLFKLTILENRKDLERLMIRGQIDLLVSKEYQDSKIRFEYDHNNSLGIQARYVVNEFLQRKKNPDSYIATEDLSMRLPGSRYVDFLIPGLIALSLLTTSLFGTGMIIVSNRRENLLKRYLVTPVKASHYIYSHILGRFLIMMVELATILTCGLFLFRFNVHGPFAHFFILCLLGTATFTAIAICFGARSKNTGSYNGMTNLVSLPMMLLSGIFYSRTHFPAWLETVTDFLPLTALVDGLRLIALEGTTIAASAFQVAVLGTYLIACLSIAKFRFKWY